MKQVNRVNKDQFDIAILIRESEAEMRNVSERQTDITFELPVMNPTRSDILKGLFLFDRFKFFLLILSFHTTKIIFQPLIGQSMRSEPLLTFWGIIGIAFFAYRHSSSSVMQYLSFRTRLDDKPTKGQFSMDFRLIGILVSTVLAFGASQISAIIIWYSSYSKIIDR